MPSTALIIRSSTLLSSLIVTALSIATLYKTGDAFFQMTTNFPPDRYVWYGDWERNVKQIHDQKMVYLKYDWSTENFIWVAAGTSIVAGLLTLIVELAREWMRWRKQQGNGVTMSKALSVTAIVFATVACIASLGATIYANVQHYEVGKTCNWGPGTSAAYPLGQPVRDVYTCTRELAVCDLIQYIARRGEDVGKISRGETRFSRTVLIPLTVFSCLVALGYGAQMWLAKRGKKEVLDAEERARRLQEK